MIGAKLRQNTVLIDVDRMLDKIYTTDLNASANRHILTNLGARACVSHSHQICRHCEVNEHPISVSSAVALVSSLGGINPCHMKRWKLPRLI